MNVSPMINLRFRARALPLNPEAWRKAERVYHWRTTFSPSAINRYFMAGLSGDKDILWRLNLGYGYFSGGSSEIQKGFLAPDFYLNCFFFCFFLLFNKRILLLILLTQTRQFWILFYCGRNVFVEDLVFKGGTCKLAVLTFDNSPITCLVALKCGSWWYL